MTTCRSSIVRRWFLRAVVEARTAGSESNCWHRAVTASLPPFMLDARSEQREKRMSRDSLRRLVESVTKASGLFGSMDGCGGGGVGEGMS